MCTPRFFFEMRLSFNFHSRGTIWCYSSFLPLFELFSFLFVIESLLAFISIDFEPFT
jgi:hypothetical protein